MTRALIPRRDTMREHTLLAAARFIAYTVIVGAVTLTPDMLVSMVTGGWG